jgi:hypothetical protein
MPFLNSARGSFGVQSRPVGGKNPGFLVNGSNVSGSINSVYSMTAGNVYAFDFSGSKWKNIRLSLWAGGGGHPNGGRGGYVQGNIALSSIPGKKFWVVVGGAGLMTYTGTPVGNGGYFTIGGFNGGGRGVDNGTGGSTTGGGGGATDVRLSYTTVTAYSTANRILVAGGGGGGTANGGANGGGGGYPNGADGTGSGNPGLGGTQTAGGALNGGFGTGGENTNNTGWNGGGGGGWYGGGAERAQHYSGGGGSSYFNPTYISSFSFTNSTVAPQTAGSAQLTVLG